MCAFYRSEEDAIMSRGRRIYLYTAALFGLIASLAGLVSFAWRTVGGQVSSLLQVEPPGGLLATPALPWLVLGLLGLATWLFHHVLANREARPLTMSGAAARALASRKAYLYGGRLVALLFLVFQLGWLLRELIRSLLDGGASGLRAGMAVPAAMAAGALLALGTWLYMRYEAGRDDDFGRERSPVAAWRRLYTYSAALIGGLLAAGGAAELIRAGIRFILTPLSGDVAWHPAAAGAAAALAVGLPLAGLAWRMANRAAAINPVAETNATGRVLLRYAGIAVATLVTLVTFGYLVAQVILRAIGRPEGAAGQPLLGVFDWRWALAYLPIAAIAWTRSAGGARYDAAWGGEKPRTAAIRRVVMYVLTAAALAAFWYGLTEFVRLILQVFLASGAGTATAAQWVQRFANAAAALLVGAPAWWGHWWAQVARVRGNPAERSSLVRRSYLVGVMVAGSVVVVAAAGFGAFLGLNWQAAGELGGVRAAVAGALAAAVVALVWTLIHWLTLRGDQRSLQRAAAATAPVTAAAPVVAPVLAPTAAPAMAPTAVAAAPILAAASAPGGDHAARDAAEAAGGRIAAGSHFQLNREDLASLAAQAGFGPAPTPQAAVGPAPLPPEARPLVVIDGADGRWGSLLVAALRQAYPDARLWPVGLTAEAHAAMFAALGEKEQAPPEDVLARAAGIFAPSDLLLPRGAEGDLTLDVVKALAESPAPVVLLPPQDARLRWVAAPDWPEDRWIENAVIEAGNILTGEA